MAKRAELKEKRRKEESRQRIIVISVVVVFALLIFGVLIYPNLKSDIVSPESITRTTVKGNAAGNPDAPVKVEEFSDYQCPYCKMWATESEAEFVKTYVETGKVYFTYTAFSFIGEESINAAQGAYCALDQGKFWQYHDILFANQGASENGGFFNNTRLVKFAGKVGLDEATFKSCLESGKYKANVETDNNLATSKGVTSTPSFIVNGQLVSMDKLNSTVDAALAAAGK